MLLSKSHGGLGLEHSHAEILKEIKFSVMSQRIHSRQSTTGDFRIGGIL